MHTIFLLENLKGRDRVIYAYICEHDIKIDLKENMDWTNLDVYSMQWFWFPESLKLLNARRQGLSPFHGKHCPLGMLNSFATHTCRAYLKWCAIPNLRLPFPAFAEITQWRHYCLHIRSLNFVQHPGTSIPVRSWVRTLWFRLCDSGGSRATGSCDHGAEPPGLVNGREHPWLGERLSDFNGAGELSDMEQECVRDSSWICKFVVGPNLFGFSLVRIRISLFTDVNRRDITTDQY